MIKGLEAFLEWGGTKREIVLLVLSGAALLVSIFFIEYLLGILIVQDRRLTVDRCVRCKSISLYRKCVSAQQYRGNNADCQCDTQSFYQMEQVHKMQSSRKFFIRESFQTPHSYYNKKNPIRKDFFRKFIYLSRKI